MGRLEGGNVDTSCFVDRSGGFKVLDLWAMFAFRSATSVSFDLGRYSDTLTLSDGFTMKVPPGVVFSATCRIDVHHPCEGHIKTQLQVVLPTEYHSFEQMKPFVATVFEALGIPSDETFEASFISPDQWSGYQNATDRNGMRDRT